MQDKVNEYAKLLTQKGLSPRTINVYVSALKLFHHYARQHNRNNPDDNTNNDTLNLHASSFLDRFNPCARSWYRGILKNYLQHCHDISLSYPLVKWTAKHPRWLTRDEIKKTLEVAGGLYQKLVIMLLYTGLRAKEFLALKVKDIDQDGYIKVINKGGDEDTIPIRDDLLSQITEYIELSGKKKDDSLFNLDYNNLRYLVKRLALLAGIDKNVTPHTFRHSFASHLAQEKMDLIGIQRLLRHKNINTTQKYIHMRPRELRDKLPKLLED